MSRDTIDTMRAAVLLPPILSLACSFDWDAYDPRKADVIATTTSAGGATASAASTGSGGAGASAGASSGGAPPLGPFGPPQLVAALSHPADDDDPTFTADGLELYFNSNRAPSTDADVWKSVRSAPTDPWGPPELVPELSSLVFDSNFLVEPDGLTFWQSSERSGQGLTDIFVSTRMTRTSPWSMPMLVPALNSPTYEAVDAITADGLTVLVDRDDQLHTSTRRSLGSAWNPLMPLAELNVSTYNADGWLQPDALGIYFSSDRSGDVDIYFAERLAPNDPFGEPDAVSELNTIELDTDAFLSPDARYIMFTRTSGGVSPREIYEASR